MSARLALGSAAALALLTACTASLSVPASGVSQAETSWTSPQTASETLLYVSNVDNEVTVYDYSSDKLVGVLAGFGDPKGLCTNRSGDVYITDASAQDIVEYAHGGTAPLQTLDDAPNNPHTCTVNQTTGDLAVADDNGQSQQSDIAIWKNGTGSPTRYTDSAIFTIGGCTYDDAGNLLISGAGKSQYRASFAWLPRGYTKFTNLFVPGPSSRFRWGAIGVGWDGRFYTIDDGSIYRIIVTHGQAYYAGSTPLDSDTEEGPFAYYYHHGKATAAIAAAGSGVSVWSYPGGGKPVATITHGMDDPFGVAVSVAKAP